MDENKIREQLLRGEEALKSYAAWARKHNPTSPLLSEVEEYLRGLRTTQGQEPLERNEQALREICENKRRSQEEFERAQAQFRDNPFNKKLEEATCAILDRIIERNQPQAKPAAKATKKRGIGNGLNRLREECGWTLYRLAKETGLDKNLVLDHVNNGKGCSLSSQQKYLDVFSQALGRKISVADLQS